MYDDLPRRGGIKLAAYLDTILPYRLVDRVGARHGINEDRVSFVAEVGIVKPVGPPGYVFWRIFRSIGNQDRQRCKSFSHIGCKSRFRDAAVDKYTVGGCVGIFTAAPRGHGLPDVVPAFLGIGMVGVLIRAAAPVPEIPFPSAHFAVGVDGFRGECEQGEDRPPFWGYASGGGGRPVED